MNTGTAVVVLIVALVVVGLIAWMVQRQRRSASLRSRFGPEYDRVVVETGGRRRAEAELANRERRVKGLSIRPLDPERRDRYSQMWNAQQSRFVDDPRSAVSEADHLVEEVMKERGYPVADFEQRAADVSVEHPAVVENYRAAHDIAERQQRGTATTEDLRKAMIYYRDLFRDLLEERPLPA